MVCVGGETKFHFCNPSKEENKDSRQDRGMRDAYTWNIARHHGRYIPNRGYLFHFKVSGEDEKAVYRNWLIAVLHNRLM